MTMGIFRNERQERCSSQDRNVDNLSTMCACMNVYETDYQHPAKGSRQKFR